jgi:MFS family permease
MPEEGNRGWPPTVEDAAKLSRRIYAAAAARSFTTGLTGVLLGLYLAEAGLNAGEVGLVVGAGLAGMALGTGVVAFYGEPLGRRGALLTVSALSAAGLIVVAAAHSVALLACAAFIGMVNGMGRDRGPAQTLDQSVLADTISADTRTRAFTRYTLIQDVAGAMGSLAAGLPAVLGRSGMAVLPAYRWTIAASALIALVPLLLYIRLPVDARRPRAAALRKEGRIPLSVESRRRVRGLAALFALDSLGGGLLAGSIVTYWFFRRFGLSGDVLGPVFFVARGLNAWSYLGAELLARRVGLLRTMVFTHLPSSVVLIALPFVTSGPLAIALFLAREALVQMDVPARQSYLAAVTEPGERTFALGITGLVRNVGWACGPPLAGWAMSAFGLGAPLVLGAGLKVVYDLALYASYRHVRPAEEARLA